MYFKIENDNRAETKISIRYVKSLWKLGHWKEICKIYKSIQSVYDTEYK